MLTLPTLTTDCDSIDKAFRIALGDLASNILPHQAGLLAEPAPVFIAGLDYVRPWTRDAAFNTWYAGAFVAPDVARNTLLSVLVDRAGGPEIGGEYWDRIVWATGAWRLYMTTADKDFLATTLDAVAHTLARSEADERDPADGLFRGGACFQDGVSAYPDAFGDPDGADSGIVGWLKRNPDLRRPTGGGLPMKALSTNALYYHAYRLAAKMTAELNDPDGPAFDAKADALKQAINAGFWDEQRGTYRYLLDAGDEPPRQEGFGLAFAILFGLADERQTNRILETTYRTPHGLPCVWPAYERYCTGGEFARHSGTVWPQVNAAWVEALVSVGRRDEAGRELRLLADKAVRDVSFYEIYHPLTGKPYGGIQEHPNHGRLHLWDVCRRQTWCATGFIHMVLTALLGLEMSENELTFSPWLPDDMNTLALTGLPYRGERLTITVSRDGNDKLDLTVSK